MSANVSLVLVVTTVIWLGVSLFGLMPLLRLPIARIKREIIVGLMGLGMGSLAVEWGTRGELHPVSLISLVILLAITLVMVHLLRRLDYYVDEVLHELFMLAVLCGAVSMVTSVWYWGLRDSIPLLLVRALVAAIPALYLLAAWIVSRHRYIVWSIGLYVALLTVKWVLFPLWGIWMIILVLLYGTLVGYVVNWLTSTTRAEKVLSWNLEPAKVWGMLAVSAGILVLFF